MVVVLARMPVWAPLMTAPAWVVTRIWPPVDSASMPVPSPPPAPLSWIAVVMATSPTVTSPLPAVVAMMPSAVAKIVAPVELTSMGVVLVAPAVWLSASMPIATAAGSPPTPSPPMMSPLATVMPIEIELS